LLGSTAERILLEGRTSVLIARKVGDAPPRRLLLAIDPSHVATRMLRWLDALVRRFDATAIALNVVDRVLLTDRLTGLPDAQALRGLEEEAIAAMSKWLTAQVRTAGLPPDRVHWLV